MYENVVPGEDKAKIEKRDGVKKTNK